jgi:dephospho-CoA kinase
MPTQVRTETTPPLCGLQSAICHTAPMLIVGLTGGLASGKSTVAERFAARGVPVIDTDVIAHELVEPGQPTLEKIRAAFGPDVLTVAGRLDRAWLRQHVFADPAQRLHLEAILHPLIHQDVVRRLPTLHGAYCLIVVPLLVESTQRYPLDRVLVVDVPETLQRQRAAARDGLRPELIAAILASQASRAQRLAVADDVIVNDADLAHLDAEVARLHTLYLGLAQSPA